MEQVGSILKRLLNSTGMRRGDTASPLFREWASFVGMPLAEHSRVVDIRNSRLIVEVDHPGWMQHLLLSKDQIVSRIGRAYSSDVVSDIRVRIAAERPKQQCVGSSRSPSKESGSVETQQPGETTRERLNTALLSLYRALVENHSEQDST